MTYCNQFWLYWSNFVLYHCYHSRSSFFVKHKFVPNEVILGGIRIRWHTNCRTPPVISIRYQNFHNPIILHRVISVRNKVPEADKHKNKLTNDKKKTPGASNGRSLDFKLNWRNFCDVCVNQLSFDKLNKIQWYHATSILLPLFRNPIFKQNYEQWQLHIHRAQIGQISRLTTYDYMCNLLRAGNLARQLRQQFRNNTGV